MATAGIVNMISGHLAMAAQRDLLERLRASLRLNGGSASASGGADEKKKLEHQRAALAAAFRSADADGSGELGLNEVAALVQSLGMHLDHRAWESLVTQLDRDASGSVSFDEFVRWYVTTAS